MSKGKKKIVTTQEFMERAREAIRQNEKYENETFVFCSALLDRLDDILSDGQKQQLSRFLDEFKGAL